MKPMYLSSVENNPNAQGSYAEHIAAARAAGQPVSQMWHLFAYKPQMSRHMEQLGQAIMRGPSPLSPGLRELIGTLVSARNRTPFCATTHAATAAELLGDRTVVDNVMQDVGAAALSPAEKALLHFCEKVNSAPWDVSASDFDALREAGWNDEAVYDAISVVALFNFANRWVSANGVCQMPDEVVRLAGKRMAEHGYIRTQPQKQADQES